MAEKPKHGGRRPGAGRPKSSDRDDITVKIDRAVAAQARFVAESDGRSLAEYLSDTLRAPVARDFAKKAREAEEKGGKH